MRSHRFTFHLLVVCAAGLLGGCDSTALEDLRDRIDPPGLYRQFWTEAQACSGKQRDFGGITWYWTSEFPGSYATVGQWNRKREITILWRFRTDRGVVMHEIIHDLLDGDGEHVDPAWEACDVPVG